MRKLTEADVTFEVIAEQDHIPVEGNVVASGDDAFDEKCENEVFARLNDGDVWAWATVTVRAAWNDCPHFSGEDYLGCCSYASEADFKCSGGYYDEMKAEALRELNAKVLEAAEAFAKLN